MVVVNSIQCWMFSAIFLLNAAWSIQAQQTALKCTVNPDKRTLCGTTGITKSSCETLGCCFDDSIRGAKACFKGICSQDVDLVFAIDASGSIETKGFEQIKQFTKDIVDSFEIGHEKTHVGVVTFSEFAEVQIKLSDTFDRNNLYERIGNLSYQGYRTATDDALRVVNREVFTLAGGARQGVAQVLIFLTDGKCTLCEDNVEDLVKPLKNRGVTIYTVGITDNINRTELDIISSDPSERHMFEVDSIDELKGIIFNLKERTCVVKKGRCQIPTPPFQCNLLGSKQKCDGDDMCDGESKCCFDGCSKKCQMPLANCMTAIDIAFALDASYKTDTRSFEKMKNLANSIVDSFEVSQKDARFASLMYSRNAEVNFNFVRYDTPTAVKLAIKRLKAGDIGTNVAKALELAKSDIFSLQGKVRSRRPLVLFVFIDNNAAKGLSEIRHIADTLKLYGVKVVVIGVGDKTTVELNQIAHSENTVFQATSFNDIIPELYSIAREACNEKPGECAADDVIEPSSCSGITNECENDFDCFGNAKCCRKGCANKCILPASACNRKLDIAFAINQNIEGADAEMVKYFLSSTINHFNIAPEGSHVALMSFGTKSNLAFNFHTVQKWNENIKLQIKNLAFENEKGKLEDVLKMSCKEIFCKTGGTRDNVPKMLIIVTGPLNPSNPDTLKEHISTLQSKGVDVITLGVGEVDSNILKSVAVSNGNLENRVWLSKYYSGILQYVQDIADFACGEAGNLFPPPETKNSTTPCGGPKTCIKGPKGSRGRNGKIGERGSIGPRGNPGIKGLPGPKGPAGVDGYMGEKGKRGIEGLMGLPGFPGLNGYPGVHGIPGRRGVDGGCGLPGSPGDAGDVGINGFQGPPGPVGSAGAKGVKGEAAVFDPTLTIRPGIKGQIGEGGNSGVKGLSGEGGTRGLDGEQGSPGNIGRKGQPGDMGDLGTYNVEQGPKGLPGDIGRSGPGPSESTGEIEGAQGPFGKNGTKGNTGDVGDMGRNSTEKGVRGPEGDQGLQGDTGPNGMPGPKGEVGLTGSKGFIGEKGLRGSPGNDGKPAGKGLRGDIGLKGFQGTVGRRGRSGEPVPSEDGKKGASGDKGLSGSAGVIGGRGSQGLKGSRGDTLMGVVGEIGDTGSRGNRGENGMPGAAGMEGLGGEKGSPGEQGQKGDSGRHGVKIDGDRGMTGPPGIKGVHGPTGDSGEPGLSGPESKVTCIEKICPKPVKGSQGRPGDTGDFGEPGEKGKTGSKGYTGDTCPICSPGEQGLSGDIGTTAKIGNKGAVGRTGDTGESGVKGSKGEVGLTGLKGLNGIKGESGDIGDVGQPGRDSPGTSRAEKGEKGPAGSPGLAGRRGRTGISGKDGQNGDKGSMGRRGQEGKKGLIGTTGERGIPGENAINGSKGEPGDGFVGLKGEEGAIGQEGAAGIDGEAGPKGRQGQPGTEPTGEDLRKMKEKMAGDIGNRGILGEAGKLGPIGPSGASGQRGLKGRKGYAGRKGFGGVKGDVGIKGKFGEDGDPGPEGYPGRQGKRGSPGENGKPGRVALEPKGEKGEIGERGSDGEPGLDAPPPPGCFRLGDLADIGFVMDSSRSVNEDDFNRQRQFIIEIIEQFNVGLDGTQAGVIKYGKDAGIEINFNEFHTSKDLARSIEDIKHDLAKESRLDLALKVARDQLFTKDAGARADNRNIEKAIIILGDGFISGGGERSSVLMENAIKYAKDLRDQGILVLTVAVGTEINELLLRNFANDDRSYLEVESYSVLTDRIGQLRQSLSDSCSTEGIPGKDGQDGFPGDKGEPGKKGDAGEGRKGSAGRQGSTGVKGDSGDDRRGDRGDVGPKGQPGDNGEVGFRGLQSAGDKGAKGIKGEEGAGIRGVDGQKGDQGAVGRVGPDSDKILCDYALATDLLFLLDTSSIGSDDHDKVLEFVQNIVKSFDVDNLLTRVSVITYGENARLQITFADFNNEAGLLNAIKDLSYIQGRSTRINKALELAVDEALTERNGARNSVRKAIVLMIGGQQSNVDDQSDIKNAIKPLVDEAILRYAVGVGDLVVRNELAILAGTNVVIADDSNILAEVVEEQINLMGKDGCKGGVGVTGSKGAVGDNGRKGIRGPSGTDGTQGLIGSQGNKGLKGYKGEGKGEGIKGLKGETGSPGPTGLPACPIGKPQSTPTDLVFMLDASASLYSHGFKKEQNFINDIIAKVGPLSADRLRAGVVVYGNNASVRIKLDDHFNTVGFTSAVDNLIYDESKSTRMDLGLKESKNAFNEENGGRGSSKKVLILLADGQQTFVPDIKQPEEYAKELAKEGVDIFSVGIGEEIDRVELEVLISKPKHIFLASDLDSLLTTLVAEISQALICEGGPRGPDGIVGEKGNPGDSGPPGPLGEQGPQGDRGEAGFGPPGDEGDGGKNGVAGDVGDKGFRGPSGIIGIRGKQGPKGKQGPIGQQGDDGEIGFLGIAGERGNPGPKGLKGDSEGEGYPGEQGPRGEKGPKGFTGEPGELPLGSVSGDWIGDSGKPGEKGEIGKEGPKGTLLVAPGPLGLRGNKGERGNSGNFGVRGPLGEKGSIGKKGDAGDVGPRGNEGDRGFPGHLGDDGQQGDKGDRVKGTKGLRGDQGNFGSPGESGPVGEGGMIGLFGVRGSKGDRGEPGRQGRQQLPKASMDMQFKGLPGEKGRSGERGNLGESGEPGFLTQRQGLKGDKGFPGDNGDRGPKGFPGNAGMIGLVGKKGLKGRVGTGGDPGVQGPIGQVGEMGPIIGGGEMGDNGDLGEIGLKGRPGMVGWNGDEGSKGFLGPNGDKGTPGDMGYLGMMGDAGPKGFPGPKGVRGDQGKTGREGVGGPGGEMATAKDSGYYIVKHSQKAGENFIPHCPRDYELMWEGYSLMYTVGNGHAHSQDLGDAGSCSKSFSTLPFLFCGLTGNCQYASRNDFTYWLSGDGDQPMMPISNSAIEPYISRCVVCKAPDISMAVHSQDVSTPDCPNGYLSLWTGYSFLMVAAAGKSGAGQSLSSTGSCLEEFRPKPFIECQGARGTCHFFSDKFSFWLVAIDPSREFDVPKQKTLSKTKGDDLTSQVSRCRVCMRIANSDGSNRPESNSLRRFARGIRKFFLGG